MFLWCLVVNVGPKSNPNYKYCTVQSLVRHRLHIFPLSPPDPTVKTEIIGHHAKTLELPLLVRSVFQVRPEGESFHGVFPPNLEGEILYVLVPCPITSVLTVCAPPLLEFANVRAS